GAPGQQPGRPRWAAASGALQVSNVTSNSMPISINEAGYASFQFAPRRAMGGRYPGTWSFRQAKERVRPNRLLLRRRQRANRESGAAPGWAACTMDCRPPVSAARSHYSLLTPIWELGKMPNPDARGFSLGFARLDWRCGAARSGPIMTGDWTGHGRRRSIDLSRNGHVARHSGDRMFVCRLPLSGPAKPALSAISTDRMAREDGPHRHAAGAAPSALAGRRSAPRRAALHPHARGSPLWSRRRARVQRAV